MLLRDRASRGRRTGAARNGGGPGHSARRVRIRPRAGRAVRGRSNSSFHTLPEPDQAASDPALHGAKWRAQMDCRLLVRHALMIHQREDLARTLLKFAETLLQPASIATERRQIGRARERILAVLDGRLIERRLASSLPQDVDASVADNAGEPRHRGAATGVEGVRIAPDKHERVLQDFLGEVTSPEYTQGEAE